MDNIATTSHFATSSLASFLSTFTFPALSSVVVLISNINLLLLGVTIPIFVFTVTLLGNAAKISNEEKTAAEEVNKKQFDEEILALNEQVKTNPHDLNGLKEKISVLETKKKFTAEKIKDIENKYKSLTLQDAVLVPGVYLVASLAVLNILIPLNSSLIWTALIICIGTIPLLLALRKVITTLRAVQEVSLNLDGSEEKEIINSINNLRIAVIETLRVYKDEKKGMRDSVLEALKAIEDQKEPKPYVQFTEKSPFLLKIGVETEFAFVINLRTPDGNEQADNVDAWFIISPEIEILPGPYGKPFQQRQSYSIPNANTVIYRVSRVRKYTRTAGSIKLKATTSGKFKLITKVNCDGHTEPRSLDKSIDISVE